MKEYQPKLLFSEENLNRLKDRIKNNGLYFKASVDKTPVISTPTNDVERLDELGDYIDFNTQIITINLYRHDKHNTPIEQPIFIINGVKDGLGGVSSVDETINKKVAEIMLKKEHEERGKKIEQFEAKEKEYIERIAELEAKEKNGEILKPLGAIGGGILLGLFQKNPQLLGAIPEQYRTLLGLGQLEEQEEHEEQSEESSQNQQQERFLINLATNYINAFSPQDFQKINGFIVPTLARNPQLINTVSELITQK
jgi:hypothetical protein